LACAVGSAMLFPAALAGCVADDQARVVALLMTLLPATRA
jgi:hypothetical protein